MVEVGDCTSVEAARDATTAALVDADVEVERLAAVTVQGAAAQRVPAVLPVKKGEHM